LQHNAPEAYGVNEHSQWVGWELRSGDQSNRAYVFLMDDGKTLLSQINADAPSIAYDINQHGVIVGAEATHP
ncbi:MAG: hypothetical protein AAGK04_11435, partial [Planctomycetota bacterium]